MRLLISGSWVRAPRWRSLLFLFSFEAGFPTANGDDDGDGDDDKHIIYYTRGISYAYVILFL